MRSSFAPIAGDRFLVNFKPEVINDINGDLVARDLDRLSLLAWPTYVATVGMGPEQIEPQHLRLLNCQRPITLYWGGRRPAADRARRTDHSPARGVARGRARTSAI